MCATKVLWVLKSGEVGALTNLFQIYTRYVCFLKIMLNFRDLLPKIPISENFKNEMGAAVFSIKFASK